MAELRQLIGSKLNSKQNCILLHESNAEERTSCQLESFIRPHRLTFTTEDSAGYSCQSPVLSE